MRKIRLLLPPLLLGPIIVFAVACGDAKNEVVFQTVVVEKEVDRFDTGTPTPGKENPAPVALARVTTGTVVIISTGDGNEENVPATNSTPIPTIKPSVTPLSNFTIASILCSDGKGPDCTKLQLGDDYLTTSTPAKGHLYSCTGKNLSAPGSFADKITWIDIPGKTWNFLKKMWLPSGAFSPEAGKYSETITNDKREIHVNNLPVDGEIGDWPLINYPALSLIDPNPGIPAPSSLSFSYPANPSVALSPTCLSLGAIGVTKNGVVIYNAADARGEDAVAREIVDIFGGHPAMVDYHYHFIPERLDNKYLSDGHSDVVGYINDGFPIYGYKGEGGVEMTNDDLDLCHGHEHGTLGYHYHATIEYPYTVGCYIGIPIKNSSDPTTSRDGRPPRMRK